MVSSGWDEFFLTEWIYSSAGSTGLSHLEGVIKCKTFIQGGPWLRRVIIFVEVQVQVVCISDVSKSLGRILKLAAATDPRGHHSVILSCVVSV